MESQSESNLKVTAQRKIMVMIRYMNITAFWRFEESSQKLKYSKSVNELLMRFVPRFHSSDLINRNYLIIKI